MPSQNADQAILNISTALNDATNREAEKIANLRSQLAGQVTQDQLAQLDAIANRLRSFGADPADPVPSEQPVPAPQNPINPPVPTT